MTFEERLAEARRLVILRMLCEALGNHLNSMILRDGLQRVGHAVGRDMVRADVTWLEQHRLVRVEKILVENEEFWVVHLTGEGEDVALGRPHPGVRKPGPK